MMNLDPEQLRAVVAASPTLVNAAAGSGKTRCLIAKILRTIEQGASPSSICAITFTNRAANEMKERLKAQSDNSMKGIQVSTIHSLCVRIMRSYIKHTPLKLPFSIYDETNQAAIIKTIVKARNLNGEPKAFISAISNVKSMFESVRKEDIIKAFRKGNNTSVFEEEFLIVYEGYQDILWKNNACDFDDLLIYATDCLMHEDCSNHYSDLWKHILVDEFQDTSMIQYKIMNLLYDPKKTKTLFVVGDFNQCVIEGTKIGNIPASEITKGSKTLAATGRGLTHEFTVDEVFKKYVTHKPVITITTESGKELTTTYEHTHFAGYHHSFPNEKYFTYLMYREDRGYRIGFTSMIRHMGQNGSILGYKLRTGQERGDYLWLLGAYDTRAEAKYFEQYYSIKYGLPTWVFYLKDRGIKSDYNDFYIKKLFKELNTENAAKRILNDLNLSIEKPHHIPKCMTQRRRRNFSIRLCAEGVQAYPLHKYALAGSNIEDKELLERFGFKVRKAKGRRGYRIEGACANLSKVYDLAEQINKVLPLNIIETAKFSDVSLPLIPASYILPGMICFIKEKDKITNETIVSTRKHLYTGYIYDFNINRTHNFDANGIITHNSVYSWRGANPENINDFIERYKPTVCNISHNYRSGSNIIKLANNFLQFGVPMVSKSAAEGSVSFTKFSSQEDEAEKIGNALLRKRGWEDTAILFRVNTRSLLFERAFASRRIPYKIVGALPYYRRRVAKDILSYLKASANRSDLESLIRIVNIPKRGFGNKKQERLLIEGWPYLQEMAKEMSKIKSLVNILDSIEGKSPADAINEVLYRTEYRKELKKDSDHTMLDSFIEVASSFPTIEELILASTFLEEDNGHGVKLMTAHASKGLEFDTVFVVGVEEGLWPHQFSTNTKEEARLFYVACTRAKKFLNISYSRSKLFRGSSMDVNPSDLFLSSFQNFNK